MSVKIAHYVVEHLGMLTEGDKRVHLYYVENTFAAWQETVETPHADPHQAIQKAHRLRVRRALRQHRVVQQRVSELLRQPDIGYREHLQPRTPKEQHPDQAKNRQDEQDVEGDDPAGAELPPNRGE